MSYGDEDEEDSSVYSSDEEYHVTSSNTNNNNDSKRKKKANKSSTSLLTSEQDREAIVRKKLLESFYGSAVSATVNDDDDNDSDDSDDSDSDNDSSSNNKNNNNNNNGNKNSKWVSEEMERNKDNLDSPYFVHESHTERHIAKSSVQELLETDERLAGDIRLLDSTMQTLVYENYSKFIDATDAIRSIGQSVHASEESMKRLESGIDRIQIKSNKMDAVLKKTRDAVSEKIRIQRLLTRLDALLKLPTTLRNQRDQGQFFAAAKSHQSATAIFEQHSAGFESLRSIQVECNDILRRMIYQLRRKLHHWSGQPKHKLLTTSNATTHAHTMTTNNRNDEDHPITTDNDDNNNSTNVEQLSLTNNTVSPPQSIAEILECAGTLFMFATDTNNNTSTNTSSVDTTIHDDNNDENPQSSSSSSSVVFSAHLTQRECKSLSLTSCKRFLERLLDDHQSDIHNYYIPTTTANNNNNIGQENDFMIPTNFLGSVLEAATLFGVTFRNNSNNNDDNNNDNNNNTVEDQEILRQFILDLFGSFIGHVRMIFLERSLQQERNKMDNSNEEKEEEDEESAFANISMALSHLLRSVRELATGLSLPEVGLDVEAASTLIDQTVQFTESMVRRRVAQKFHALRLKVLNECFIPFAKDIQSNATLQVVDIIQMANVVLLSDSMQLTEDVIRSVLETLIKQPPSTNTKGTNATVVDSTMIKHSVLKNARQFAFWFASMLETASGCYNDTITSYNHSIIMDVYDTQDHNDDDDDDDSDTDHKQITFKSDMPTTSNTNTTSFTNEKNHDDTNITIMDDDDDIALSFHQKHRMDDDYTDEEKLVTELMTHLEANNIMNQQPSSSIHVSLTLALSEICRLAEETVVQSMNQSIASSTEVDTRATMKASGFFLSPNKTVEIDVNFDKAVSARFHLAASRCLVTYASCQGSYAADLLCTPDWYSTSFSEEQSSSNIPTAPSDSAWKVLQVAKSTCIECSDVFGGERMAAEVPPIPDEEDTTGISSHLSYRLGAGTGGHSSAIKGLQMDVERMFTENVKIYPDVNYQMTFTRNEVIFIMFKISLKALIEHSRHCMYTNFDYRQMQVNMELIKHMIPHYVGDEPMEDGTNALSSLTNLINTAIVSIEDRCLDPNFVGTSDFHDANEQRMVSSTSIAHTFLMKEFSEDDGGLTSKFVIDSSEG